jgi:hypothetical protein
MVIVFDAGPLTDDRALKRPGSRALLDQCAEGHIRLVVPRVVFEEVVRATRGWLSNAKRSRDKAQHNLDEAFAQPPSLPQIDVDGLTARYRDELRQRLEDHHVVIASWDAVSHDEIVARDLERKPPFDQSGRGYRDTLIWHVIEDLVVEENERVIFITKDGDFSSDDEESALHPSLVEEIGGDKAAVTIVRDLSEAMRLVGEARDEFSEQLGATIAQEPNTVGTMALSLLDEVLLPHGLQSDLGDGWLHNVEVAEVYEVWGVWSAVVYGELEFEYTGTLNEAEYEAFFESEGKARLYSNEVEWDEEQRYAIIDGTGVVNVALSVTYDPEDGALDVTEAVLTEVSGPGNGGQATD